MDERVRKSWLSWLSLMRMDMKKISSYEIKEDMINELVEGIKNKILLLEKIIKINGGKNA